MNNLRQLRKNSIVTNHPIIMTNYHNYMLYSVSLDYCVIVAVATFHLYDLVYFILVFFSYHGHLRFILSIKEVKAVVIEILFFVVCIFCTNFVIMSCTVLLLQKL